VCRILTGAEGDWAYQIKGIDSGNGRLGPTGPLVLAILPARLTFSKIKYGSLRYQCHNLHGGRIYGDIFNGHPFSASHSRSDSDDAHFSASSQPKSRSRWACLSTSITALRVAG